MFNLRLTVNTTERVKCSIGSRQLGLQSQPLKASATRRSILGAVTAPPAGSGQLRLAELVALLSLGTDLGLGQPMEHMIRACLIALRLADLFDMDPPGRAA